MGPNTLVVYTYPDPEEEDNDFQPGTIRPFMPNESSTFKLSGLRVPAIPGFELMGDVAHDVVSLNGITLPSQKIGTSQARGSLLCPIVPLPLPIVNG